jgi:hypothetical protein
VSLLAIDNLEGSTEGASSARPGRGLGDLVTACHPGYSAADVHLFRVLSKLVRAQVEGAGSYRVAIYRGPAPDGYRLDVYPQRGNGTPLGRLSAEVRVSRDGKGGLAGGRLELLGRCAAGETTGCSTLNAYAELTLQRPTAEGEETPKEAAKVVFSPVGAAAQGEAEIEWPALLAGSSWQRPIAGAGGIEPGFRGTPGQAPAKLAEDDVLCDSTRLVGLIDRLGIEAPPASAPGVNLSFTRTGDFAGIAYRDDGPGAVAGQEARHLAFSTNPEETTLLRNPARPQLLAVSLSRNPLNSDLVSAGGAGLLRLLLDPRLSPGGGPSSGLLAIDNVTGPGGGSTDARPGRGLAALASPCHGKLSERDVHVFRVLAKLVRARTEGAAATRLAIFRGQAPNRFRIDAYPQPSGGPATGWGRLAAELEVTFGPGDELMDATLRLLPRCAPGGARDCTDVARPTELFLVRPAAGGAAGGSAGPRVTSAALPTGSGATSAVDFVELLAGTTWTKPL